MKLSQNLVLDLFQKQMILSKRFCICLLILFSILHCDDKNTTEEFQNGFIISFAIGVLPGLVNNCPGVDLVVEKGIDYPISVEKDKISWFQFSQKGNLTPPEETRDYYFTITKDSAASISLISWTSCKNFSSPSRNGLTPDSETPTELKFKIGKDSFRFAETNRYRLELNSPNQTNVTVRQN